MHLKELKEHWQVIREELDKLPDNYVQEEPRVYGDWLKSDGISHILAKYVSGSHGWIKGWQKGWEQWPIIWDSKFVESNAKFSPKTVELLKNIPNIKVAAFALMKGGVKLKAHTDPVGSNYKFTYHLGLKCPKGCYLHHQTLGDVEEEDGKHIVMNARFPHWAENTSQEDRVILYIEYYTS
jgi:beta-hydroxylase